MGAYNEGFRVIHTVGQRGAHHQWLCPTGTFDFLERYTLKLAQFRGVGAYFEKALNPDQPVIRVSTSMSYRSRSTFTILKYA
jgi:hypothetical protein